MISITKSKMIRSLERKKSREQHKLFVVEGIKMVRELLNSDEEQALDVVEIFASSVWIDQHGEMLPKKIGLNHANEQELRKVSQLHTPQQVLALVRIPEQEFDIARLSGETVLGLESVRDPGNLGTIVRTADWFGIRSILCTPDSVDLYNPKVVQATMGAIARTRVHYVDLEQVLQDEGMKNKAVYGTYLKGENIYKARIEAAPLILFGNESLGLSDRYNVLLKGRLSIPSFAMEGAGSESLNLASSVAIVCSELRRRG